MFAWFIVCFTLLQSYLCSVFYSPLFIYFIMNIHILRSMALPTFLMCKRFHFMALSDFKQSLIFGNFYDFFVFLWSIWFLLYLFKLHFVSGSLHLSLSLLHSPSFWISVLTSKSLSLEHFSYLPHFPPSLANSNLSF